jgi:hypothetical protein
MKFFDLETLRDGRTKGRGVFICAGSDACNLLVTSVQNSFQKKGGERSPSLRMRVEK